MKPLLVIGSVAGAVALAGVAAIGSVYMFPHAAPPPPPAPVAQVRTPLPAPTGASEEDQTPVPVSAPTRRRRLICPQPAVYRHHAHRIVHRIAYAPPPRPIYGPPPIYAAGPPPPYGWYGHPYWRVGYGGWRGPRWGYGPRFGYGPGWGRHWRRW